MSIRSWLLFVCLSLLLAGCTSRAVVTLPTLPLRRAVFFVDGEALIPEGRYLFVEYFVVNDAITTNNECPFWPLQIDFPEYRFRGGQLIGSQVRVPLIPGKRILGFAGSGEALQGARGGGISSRLDKIMALPYTLSISAVDGHYDGVVVHSVYEDGEIVAGIGGSTYLMAPGESWVERVEQDLRPDCHTITIRQFTNYGLLDQYLRQN